jgi:diguanylate cyclase (GGDEF)-like protein
MPKVAWFKILVAAVLYAGALVSASSQAPLGTDIATVTEPVDPAPREAPRAKPQVSRPEATNQHAEHDVWRTIALTSSSAWIALLWLYRRSRMGNRLLEETNRQLYTSSNRDSLTGLFNRRYVEGYVARIWRRCAEGQLPVSAGRGLVLLMDIDHFKRLNDTWGHAVGDEVLQVTAARLSTLFRNEDIVARWGGEEFLALLPTTRASEATGIAARVLGAVSATPVVVNGTSINVTVSVGICALRLRLKDREMNWDEVVHTADQALYLAKQNGRNMAYGATEAANTSSVEMAQGLRLNWDEGKIDLIEVFGDGSTSAAEQVEEEPLLRLA